MKVLQPRSRDISLKFCAGVLGTRLGVLRLKSKSFFSPAHVSHCCTVGPLGFVKSQSAKIECDLTGSFSKVIWYKDNKSLENGTDGLYQSIVQLMDGTTRSILHFPVVKMAHEAIYRCKANSNKSTICPNGKRFSVIVVCKY